MSARSALIHRLEAVSRRYGVTVLPQVWHDDIDDVEREARAGAEAELLALRPVVEAAVAWAIPWKEPEEAMAANGALVDAVAHYQRGLSGRADAARASREPSE